MKKLLKIALGAVGLAIGVIGVLSLREATLSTHNRVAADQTDLQLTARTRGGEGHQTLAEMVEAQIQTCRLEVTSDLVEPVESLGSGRFRAALAPAMDETNRRQFRGCLEDWVIDHVLIDVTDLSNSRVSTG